MDDRARDWGEGELDLALGRAHCPACLLAAETESAILSWLAKVNIHDRETVNHLVVARGLCGAHWSDLLRRSDGAVERALGRALAEVARAAVEDLRLGTTEVGPRCPVCASMRRRSRNAIAMILGRLDDPVERRRFASSFGLCQPHLADALRSAPDARLSRELLLIQRLQLGRLLDGLRAGAEDGRALPRAARLLAVKLAGSNARVPR